MSHFDQLSDFSKKSFLHRGGRIVKWKGGTASMVPHIAELRLSVSAAAVGAALIFGAGIGGVAPAMAGTCTETAVGSGEFVCSGPAGADATQVLNGTPVTVTTEADFGIAVFAAGDALEINGVDGASFEDAEASVIGGGQNGIDMSNMGSGSLSLTSNGAVTGLADDGINAVNGVGAMDLTINAADSSGGTHGIDAFNAGTGSLTIISTGTATGITFNGIDAYNFGNGTDLTVNAVDANGGRIGIDTTNNGSGSLTISSTGAVSGTDFDGIEAENSANGTDLTINAVDSSGGERGIEAINEGSGALTITSTGTAIGIVYDGILAFNDSDGTDLTINAFDSSGGTNGIDGYNDGTGALTIISTGAATGALLSGIEAFNNFTGTDLTITAVDSSGGENGINAYNDGSGALTITSAGTAIGIVYDGIEAFNHLASTDLTVTAVDSSGGENGISAYNDGNGALTITSTGAVTGTIFSGIDAFNDGTDLTVTAVDSSGGTNGISAYNDGSGALTITSTGAVTGALLNGIEAFNSTYGSDLIINAVDSSGGLYGIDAINEGSGALIVSSTGTVTGGFDGIEAVNQGNGALMVSSTGTATGTLLSGIDANNSVNGTDLTVNAFDSNGGENGIDTVNLGTGALTITSTGTVTGADFDGIYAFNSGAGTDLTINAVDTNGGQVGIAASNFGAGALTINSTGTATGTAIYGIGVSNSANGTDLTVNALDSSGGESGIVARNSGNGTLTVTSAGAATGATFDGIYARATANGTDVVINAVDTNGGRNGIDALSFGTGALTITLTGTAAGLNDDGIYAANSANGTDLTVNAVDSSGGDNGIDTYSAGTGALTITSTGMATGTALDGINASNSANGTDLTINAVDSSGGDNGIDADNDGSGALTINSTGTAIGTGADGIAANNSANGTSLLVASNVVTGNNNGIAANNQGAGVLSITATGAVTGIDFDGIEASNSVNGTDLTISATDSSGGINGIIASNDGNGALTITSTGTVTGTVMNGIAAFNIATGTDITVNAVNTSGGETGIYANNSGTGALTISTTGATTGTQLYGIYAINSANSSSLSITAAEVAGGTYGIFARNYGTAGLTISTTGDVTGGTQAGVFAYNSANDVSGSMEINQAEGTTITGATDGIYANNLGGSLTINAVDTNGGVRGISAINSGTGALIINSTGTATAANNDAIDVYNSANGTYVTVNAIDSSGNNNGINAQNSGSGALTVTSTGTATGINFDGIEAYNSVNGTSLTVTAVNAAGGLYGIFASNEGSGALRISSTGIATGTAIDGIGAYNSANGTALSVSAGDVSGGVNGIDATNVGSGALTITSTGAAMGGIENGIDAFNSANGTDLTVNAVDTSGGLHGIDAINNGSGAITVISTGTATGAAYDGIAVESDINSTDLTVNAVDSIGNVNGIDASHNGTGALTITSTGTATGTTFYGIDAFNSVNGTDLNVTAVDTNGGRIGIFANNQGIGALTLTSTGTAVGTDYAGIAAINSASGTSLTIAAVNATGGGTGIFARNLGTAGLTITTSGDITGETQAGVDAYNSANDVSGSMEINQAEGTTITGATDGIYADNLGGSLTINALGTVVGLADDGIDARNGVGTTDLTITSNVATGAANGILANNQGSGALRISSTGTATGTNDDGIAAFNSANGTGLSISAVDTLGAGDGIAARNEGSGALTITSTGTATGTDFNGIVALTNANGTSLTVNAADTNGGRYGIYANNQGSGVLTITSTGTAIGTDFDGINADNSANGTDLTINASDSSGGEHGIDALNNGSGALTITSTGTATGVALDGIEAFNSANGTDVMVNAVDTNGNNIGIDAQNNGSGALRVSSTGTATGTGFDGINALNSASGTDLTIVASDSSGGENGIDAVNYGSGALTITSTGRASGATLNGIDASNSANGGALSVTAADVSGGIDGIYASQQGVDPLVVTTSGTVAGGTGNAITALTAGATITVGNSGTLESGAGFALAASGGVTELTNSGTINGRVQLSAFDDVVVNSGLFNATADSDFGAGNDLFTNDGMVTVQGAVTLLGLEQFINNDVIDMQNGAVGNGLTIPGDYVGNGSLEFDVSFDGAGLSDRLIIAGAATGSTAFVIDDISASPNFGNMVLVVDAGAGTSADAFSLSEESATIGFFAYSVSFDAAGNDFFLTNTIGTPVFQMLKFAEGAQSLWYRSADAWAAHMASPSDGSASPAWMQVYGSVTNQDDSFDFTSGGFTQNISLDYEQDYFGFQLGYEFGPGVADDGVLFGITSGYLTSNLGFDGTADNVRYDAFNIGAYAGFKSEGFFANALVKYDFIDADVTARTAGYAADLDGNAYGIRLEAGYRWGDDSFFVQPLASVEYQQASLDDFSALGANVNFDSFDGLRGMAGVRLGGESKVNGSNTLTYYAGGQAVHQSQTDDGLSFTSGTSSIQIDNRLSNTFGRFELGLSIASPDGVSGFIEGNSDISGDYTGYGGRAGLKIQF